MASAPQPPSWTDGKAPVSVSDLQQCLAVAGILSLSESQAFIEQLDVQPDSAKALAAELGKAGKITRFQASGLLQGKLKYLLFGEYLVLDKLGAGGMGQVLKAEHRRMKRVVALKVMSGKELEKPDAVRRFQREVQAAARLIHPNIVTAFDANEANGIHFLVMEFVDGRDLASILYRHGPLFAVNAVDCILQAARGLTYAHENGVIHRDIKPGNLLLDRRGTVKILDMGLARLCVGEDQPVEELTDSNQMIGTVDYMAPEQALDTRTADARSDIYSLGCTLYRLITGRLMYDGDTVLKKILGHREAPLPSLAAYAGSLPGLDAIFQKMVAKRPQDRYQTMSQVIAELEAMRRQDTGDGAVSSKAGRPELDAPSNSSNIHGDPSLASFLAGLSGSGTELAGQATLQADWPQAAGLEETIDVTSPSESTEEKLASLARNVPANRPTPLPGRRQADRRRDLFVYGAIAAGMLIVVAIVCVVLFLSQRAPPSPLSPKAQVPSTAALDEDVAGARRLLSHPRLVEQSAHGEPLPRVA